MAIASRLSGKGPNRRRGRAGHEGLHCLSGTSNDAPSSGKSFRYSLLFFSMGYLEKKKSWVIKSENSRGSSDCLSVMAVKNRHMSGTD
ncbi:MAG: hypothetical protein NXH99_07220 [Rhodobacteraceae bacterium]|nr:hypothetical protein [Paracoccaceae bacterium]